jgi:hypothetical protein
MSGLSEQNAPMADELIHVRCVCGWETAGSEDEVVAATEEHGERVHNMRASREEILAMAVPRGE